MADLEKYLHTPFGSGLADLIDNIAHCALDSCRAHRKNDGPDKATAEGRPHRFLITLPRRSLEPVGDRGHSDGRKPVGREGRSRGGSKAQAGRGLTLDSRTAEGAPADKTPGKVDYRRLQPGAVHPPEEGEADRMRRSGKRGGHRPGACPGRLRRHMDCARKRRRKQPNGGSPEQTSGPSRGTAIYPKKGLADEGGRGGLLLWVRQ